MVDRLTIQKPAEHLHVLAGPLVTGLRFQLLTRHVAGDDVDPEPTPGHLVDGGYLACQLGWPDLTHAYCQE